MHVLPHVTLAAADRCWVHAWPVAGLQTAVHASHECSSRCARVVLSPSQDLERIESGMQACTSSSEVPVVCFVSKMVAVPLSALPRRAGEAPRASSHGTCFVAFGRVFCGVLRDGDVVHVLSAAYHPLRPHAYRQEVKVLRRLHFLSVSCACMWHGRAAFSKLVLNSMAMSTCLRD